MVTGCAPFFLMGLVGVALGSWFFGSHSAARLSGLALLALFVLYFALLNWTAQARLQRRRKEEVVGTETPPPAAARTEEGEESQTEWIRYLRTEGRILWSTLVFLLLIILSLAARG